MGMNTDSGIMCKKEIVAYLKVQSQFLTGGTD